MQNVDMDATFLYGIFFDGELPPRSWVEYSKKDKILLGFKSLRNESGLAPYFGFPLRRKNVEEGTWKTAFLDRFRVFCEKHFDTEYQPKIYNCVFGSCDTSCCFEDMPKDDDWDIFHNGQFPLDGMKAEFEELLSSYEGIYAHLEV